jgi:predicted RNase H-like nuclease
MTVVAGIDGCRGGWLCLVHDRSTHSIRSHILTRIGEFRSLRPRPDAAFIDIPIGLPDAGPRTCDIEARRMLGHPRGTSVFPAPLRPMLNAESYPQACRIGQLADGRKLSRQTWNIIPKIREVDDFLRLQKAWPSRFHETHPELAFAIWNGGRAMTHSKKTPAGRTEREALVRSAFEGEMERAVASLPRRLFVFDDLLDAFAAVWSAGRWALGQTLGLPLDPPCDSRGLPMAITV